MVLKISKILKPKSKKEIRESLNKLNSVDRFCVEFSFRYMNSKTNSMKLINSIIKKIPNKDAIRYYIDEPIEDKSGVYYIIKINLERGMIEKIITIKEPRGAFNLIPKDF
jgi:hypothetical protein